MQARVYFEHEVLDLDWPSPVPRVGDLVTYFPDAHSIIQHYRVAAVEWWITEEGLADPPLHLFLERQTDTG